MPLLTKPTKDKREGQEGLSKVSIYSSLFSIIYQKAKRFLVHLGSSKSSQIKDQEHLLIRGDKGAGKSLLIKQLAQHLTENGNQTSSQEPNTKTSLIVRLNEYEYGIRSIKDLCSRIRSKLRSTHSKELAEHFHPKENISWPSLIEEINNTNSRLILLIDNLDILLKQLDKSDNLFFVKNILTIEQPYYRLIASCQKDSQLTQPFVSLDIPQLDKTLAYKLLISLLHKDMLHKDMLHKAPSQANKALKNQSSEKQSSEEQVNVEQKYQVEQNCLNFTANKLEAVRRFSHANAQTLEYFSQALLDTSLQTSHHYLRYVLRHYQAQYDFKMQHLSSQQQLIVHTLASHWQAIKVAQLTQECDLASKTISAQLTQLEKQTWVEKIPSQNKNLFYRITDKRFHISYLMRFSSPKTQALITHSLNTLSYFSLSIPYMDEYKVQQNNTVARSRLQSLAYQEALKTNEDVSQTELEALFHHAFLQQGEGEIDGQAYCDSASQYFKAHLPGERLSFLLTAASKGYEQAYLGLLSLFDLANTELEANLAYRIKLAICQLAQSKGFNVEDKLVSLYLSHAQETKQAYQLSMQVVIVQAQETSPLLLIQASFATLLEGCRKQSHSLLMSYLKFKTLKNEQERINIEAEWTLEEAWLMELLLLLIAKKEWDFFDQFMAENSEKNTYLRSYFLPIYHAFLALKPELSDHQKDEQLARPIELSDALPLIINAVKETRRVYLKQ